MTLANRAYSALTIKSFNAERRTFSGIATTPTVDRMGDVVDPLGVSFKNPMPLLWQHRADQPIGKVRFKKPTKDGVEFDAEVTKWDRPGELKDRLDSAWDHIEAGLVPAVSIGFRPLEYAFMDTGGVHFTQVEVYELSAVTIPANADAVIFAGKALDADALRVVKSFDTGLPAATGTKASRVSLTSSPGVAGNPPQANTREPPMAKSIAEQIAALEANRTAKFTKMESVIQKSVDEGRSTDLSEQEEFDGLQAEVEALDGDLKRLRVLEKALAGRATPVGEPKSQQEGAQGRVYPTAIKSPPKLAPGIRFARFAKCVAMAKGSLGDALQIAQNRYGDDEALLTVAKAAVGAGTTLASNWAADLVSAESAVFADFAEYLRPATIIGKFGNNGIPALRNIPFRVPLIVQTGGGQGYWVGQGRAKPLTAFDFDRTTLEPLKVANIAVLTEESIRDTSPNSETIVRDALRDALVARLDTDFVDPAKAAVAGVSPASITNGATTAASSGGDADAIRTDVRTLFASFIAANNAPTSGVWIMSATTALALSMLTNPLGQAEFPGIGMTGGTFNGMPVIVSEYVGNRVILVNANDIFVGDEGGVSVDMSREASIEMVDGGATQDATTGTGVAMVSMFQTNSVALRAERTINWKRRRASAVAYLTAVTWGVPDVTP